MKNMVLKKKDAIIFKIGEVKKLRDIIKDR